MLRPEKRCPIPIRRAAKSDSFFDIESTRNGIGHVLFPSLPCELAGSPIFKSHRIPLAFSAGSKGHGNEVVRLENGLSRIFKRRRSILKHAKLVIAAALAGIFSVGGPVNAQVATGNTAKMKIALSNNYAGNSWRQAMLKSWETVTKDAVKAGVVAEAPAFTTAQNQATEQAQQIQNMILQGYNAIVVNAASPTALNGVVKQACAAGVVVVSFDGIVTEPCAYRIAVDFKKMGAMQLDYLNGRLNGKGNLLEIRGLAGVFVDDEIHAGIESGLKKFSGLKRVGSVHGNWTQTVAQKEVAGVLPTLPKVDAIVTQGGDGFGAAEAFKAAGRPMPIIIMGNRHEELAWWKEQSKSGYQTMSVSIAPGASTYAFWVAQQILGGKKVPHDMVIPLVEVTQKNLDQMLSNTAQGSVTNVEYSRDEVVKQIDAAPKK